MKQLQENILRHLGMVLGAGSGEQVEGNTQLLPAVEELCLVKTGYLRRGLAFLFGFNGYRGAVLVRPGYHKNIVASGSVVAGKDIRR